MSDPTCEVPGQLGLDAFEILRVSFGSSVVSHNPTRIGRLGQKLGQAHGELMNGDICIPRKPDEILAGSVSPEYD